MENNENGGSARLKQESVKLDGEGDALESLLDPIFNALRLPAERRTAITDVFHSNDIYSREVVVFESSYDDLKQLDLSGTFLRRLLIDINAIRANKNKPPLEAPSQPSGALSGGEPSPAKTTVFHSSNSVPAPPPVIQVGQGPSPSQSSISPGTAVSGSTPYAPQDGQALRADVMGTAIKTSVPWDRGLTTDVKKYLYWGNAGGDGSDPVTAQLGLHAAKTLPQLMPSGGTAVPRAAVSTDSLNLFPRGMTISGGGAIGGGATPSTTGQMGGTSSLPPVVSGISSHLSAHYGVQPTASFTRSAPPGSPSKTPDYLTALSNAQIRPIGQGTQDSAASHLFGIPPRKVQRTASGVITTKKEPINRNDVALPHITLSNGPKVNRTQRRALSCPEKEKWRRVAEKILGEQNLRRTPNSTDGYRLRWESNDVQWRGAVKMIDGSDVTHTQPPQSLSVASITEAATDLVKWINEFKRLNMHLIASHKQATTETLNLDVAAIETVMNISPEDQGHVAGSRDLGTVNRLSIGSKPADGIYGLSGPPVLSGGITTPLMFGTGEMRASIRWGSGDGTGGHYKAEIQFPNGSRKSFQRSVKAAGGHEAAEKEVKEWMVERCQEFGIRRYRCRGENRNDIVVDVAGATPPFLNESGESGGASSTGRYDGGKVKNAFQQKHSITEEGDAEADDEQQSDDTHYGNDDDDQSSSSDTKPDQIIAILPLSQSETEELRRKYGRVCVDIIEVICFLASFEVQPIDAGVKDFPNSRIVQTQKYSEWENYIRMSTNEFYRIFSVIRSIWNPACLGTENVLFREKVIACADCLWRLLCSIKDKPLPASRAVGVDGRLAPLGDLKEQELADILEAFDDHIRFITDPLTKLAVAVSSDMNLDGIESFGVGECKKYNSCSSRRRQTVTRSATSLRQEIKRETADVTAAAAEQLADELEREKKIKTATTPTATPADETQSHETETSSSSHNQNVKHEDGEADGTPQDNLMMGSEGPKGNYGYLGDVNESGSFPRDGESEAASESSEAASSHDVGMKPETSSPTLDALPISFDDTASRPNMLDADDPTQGALDERNICGAGYERGVEKDLIS